MKTEFLKLPGGMIAYETTGAGPLVICVPGMGDLRGEYRFLAAQLAQAGFRAVSMDLRGHGESSTGWDDYSVAGIGSDILALARHLDGGPALVVGASMGAGAAVWAAAEAPEWVSGLALVGPFVRGGGDRMGRLLAGTLFARPWGPGVWAKYYASLYPTRKPADFTPYTAALKRNLAEPGRLEALQAMLRASKRASEERLAQVQAPALVIMGSRDPDFKPPEAEARWVAQQVGGTVQMVEGAGHYPQVEMPEVTGPLVLEFARSLPMPEAAHAY